MHIYILGSPRTGSTIFYIYLCKLIRNSYYITNKANSDYYKDISLYLQKFHSKINDNRNLINDENKFGKTKGDLAPSEGSNVFMNWFNNDHPSEINAASFQNDYKKTDFIKTHNFVLSELESIFITKNAWNCFRIEEIVKTNVPIFFIWIRRSLTSSALSDLESRCHQGDPSKIWNSATTKNYQEIQKLPAVKQVVEQQYYYNKKIKNDLNLFANENQFEFWFEDFCADPAKIIKELFKIKKLNTAIVNRNKNLPIRFKPKRERKFVNQIQKDELENYICQNENKFKNIYKILY